MDFKHPLNPRKLVGALLRHQFTTSMVTENYDTIDPEVIDVEIVLKGRISREQWDWMCDRSALNRGGEG